MRAVAVGLVVLSHAGLTGLAGGYVGVDVFFVISGFLITTLLLNEVGRSGTVSLAGFYARRALRLLPASALVLVATVVAAWCWLPATRFESIRVDALYATFYGINWRLADEGVDYLNADAAPSPLQHFWSLAVEEQFYLVWPLLMLILVMGRGDKRTKKPLVGALLVITAGSLCLSITQTQASAPWAYFGAHTRAWELAVGALVAIGAPRLSRLGEKAGLEKAGRGENVGPGERADLSERTARQEKADPRQKLQEKLAAALSWAGLAAILTAAIIYDEHTPFPGSAATLPVLGAAAIIAAGCSAPRGGASVLLRRRPFQLVGRYSYSLYLWHWPVLMIGPAALGLEPTLEVNLILVTGSLALAAASYHLVENPVRRLRMPPWQGIGLGLGLSGATAALAMVASGHMPPLPSGGPAANTVQSITEARDPGIRVRQLVAESARFTRLPANLRPNVLRARQNKPVIYPDGCHRDWSERDVQSPCLYGDPKATETMFLFGDSHAAHWFPPVHTIAAERGLKLASRTKSACQAATVLVFSVTLKHPYHECFDWREKVFREIERTRPKFVVISSSSGDSGGMINAANVRLDEGPDRDQLWTKAWIKTFDRVRATGATIVFIEDTPWPSGSAPECLAKNPNRVDRCARPAAEAFLEPARRVMVAEAARARGATVIDTRSWFCTAEICPPVIGNTLVWKDNSHLTTAVAKAMTPLLRREFPR